MIHVYAFTIGSPVLQQTPGLDGADLDTVCFEELAAVVSRHDSPSTTDAREAAAAHGLVVEALREVTGAVLPVRYGETFADEAALLEALAANAPRLRRGLELVGGCVEIGVRVQSAARPAVATTGTEYLRARFDEVSQSARLAEQLAPIVRAWLVSPGGEAAFLVRSDRATSVLAAVDAFAGTHPEVAVTSTGPWAPYSFGGEAA